MDNETIAAELHKLHPKILELVQFFHDFEWVFNFKMTELLFHENLQNVPTELKRYFQSFTEEHECSAECNNSGIELIVHAIVHARPEGCDEFMPIVLRTFIRRVHELRKWETIDEVEAISTNEVVKQRKWGKKKSEEVKYVAQFVGDMCVQHNCDLVLDIGSGLGYLSTFLAETFKIPVVAIESYSEKTVSAHAISFRVNGGKLEGNTSLAPKITHVNLELTSDIASEISEFVGGKTRICVTGLHSCGDLTPWSLKLFLSDSKYSAVAIVPCCYHKMKFDSDKNNIPLSNGLMELLRKKYSQKSQSQTQFFSKAYFCRLASQRRGEGILKDIENESKHVFYRALLEFYAKADNYEIRKVKRNCRMGNRLCTFDDYLHKTIGPQGGFEIISKFGNSIPPKSFEEHRQCLLQLHEEKKDLIGLASGLNAMQAALQQLAEELILLDRLEYLLESGKVWQAKIRRVIPCKITPRGFVIFATKLQ